MISSSLLWSERDKVGFLNPYLNTKYLTDFHQRNNELGILEVVLRLTDSKLGKLKNLTPTKYKKMATTEIIISTNLQ